MIISIHVYVYVYIYLDCICEGLRGSLGAGPERTPDQN